MRNYYTILSILLTANSSYATPPISDLVKKLSEVLEIKCEEMTSDELANHCAKEVCGAPGSKSSRITSKNINKFMTPKQQAEFKSIEKDVARVVEIKKKEIQDMISELNARKSDPKFQDTSNWKDYEYSNFSNFFWKYFTWNVDYSRPLKERVRIELSEFTDPVLLPGVEELASEFKKNIYDDPLYAYDSGVFDENDLKNAIIEKAKKLKEELSSQNKSNLLDLKSFSDELSKQETKDQIALQFQKIENIANDNGVVLVKSEFYCKEKCKKAIDDFIHNEVDLNSIIDNLKMSLDYIDEEDKVAECKANYIKVNQQNNLSQNFEKIWPKVKEGYLQNVLPRFSKHSQEMMKNYLNDGVHFYFENPTYDTFADLDEMLNKDKKENLKEKKNAELFSDLAVNYYDTDFNVFMGEVTICDKSSTPSLIWDSYLAKENMVPSFSSLRPYYDNKKDNIAVSPFTCEHHREGAGILAHELGHAMGQLMTREGMSQQSLKDYRKLRSCASQQWDISETSSNPYHDGDKQFTEEDSADILSYMAINDGASLYACGFLETDFQETQYTSFDTEPWGVHSPSLVRLMREMSYKIPDKIPKTCNYLMSKHQDKLGDKKCF